MARLLQATGYNLQVNRKTREGDSHPDRDAQFEYIAGGSVRSRDEGQPVVSVDTKKKELVGDFKNAGREWQPEGSPEEVRCKDFKDKDLGKVPLMASTTRRPTRAGSVWGSITIRPSSPPRRCGVGGRTWGSGSIPGRPTCW